MARAGKGASMIRNGCSMAIAAMLAVSVAGCSKQSAPDENPIVEQQSQTDSAAMPAALPSQTQSSPPQSSQSMTPDPSASAMPKPATELDFAALTDRQDPDRLLRFYAEALRLRMWKAAASVWDADARMTPQRLAKTYGGQRVAKLTFGKGDEEGAAGSLYYQAPVTVDFSDGSNSLRGTITLHRVNDVPGASQAQLNWRIELSTITPAS